MLLTPLRFTIEHGRCSPRVYYKVVLAAESQAMSALLNQVWGHIYLDDPAAKDMLLRVLRRTP